MAKGNDKKDGSMQLASLDKIVDVCKRRGIAFPTAEVYGALSGFWDYGPVGTLMKRKIEDLWRKEFVLAGTEGAKAGRSNIVEMSGSVVFPEVVFKASGHVEGFVDPITQCKKCKSIHRADHLIEEKAKKFVEGKSVEELTIIIKAENIACPNCQGELGDVKRFNLMLPTNISAVGDQPAYLRPETAQNMFTAFKRVFLTSRGKLPFGIAQIGHVFRNEISPRHFIIRVREINQMEIEMFLDPDHTNECGGFDAVKNEKLNFFSRENQVDGKDMESVEVGALVEKGKIPNTMMGYIMARQMQFYQSMWIPASALRHRHMLPEETPHYSRGNFDLEIFFGGSIGWKETVGNAFRGDYDLKKHGEYSKTDMSVTTDDGRRVVPLVVEPSFGFERTFTGVLLHCYREDKERGWDWFAFPARIAPFTAAILPLMKKDGLSEKAEEVAAEVGKMFDVTYDEGGSVGKRYARYDEIGVPYCVTIDYDSLDAKKDTVTIRDRDTTKQILVKRKDLCGILWQLCEGTVSFEKAGKIIEVKEEKK
jgi:glycyl-tRNA synthetase